MVALAEISLFNAMLSVLSLSGICRSSWYCKDSRVHHIYSFIHLHAFLSFCIWNKSGKLWPVSDCHLKHVHWICALWEAQETANTSNKPRQLPRCLFLPSTNWAVEMMSVITFTPGWFLLSDQEKRNKNEAVVSFLQEFSPWWKHLLNVQGEYVLSTGMSWGNPRAQTISRDSETHRNQRFCPLLGFTDIFKDASDCKHRQSRESPKTRCWSPGALFPHQMSSGPGYEMQFLRCVITSLPPETSLFFFHLAYPTSSREACLINSYIPHLLALSI